MKGEFIIDRQEFKHFHLSQSEIEEVYKKELLHEAVEKIAEDIELKREDAGGQLRCSFEFAVLNEIKIKDIREWIIEMARLKPGHEIEWRLKEIFKIVN